MLLFKKITYVLAYVELKASFKRFQIKIHFTLLIIELLMRQLNSIIATMN